MTDLLQSTAASDYRVEAKEFCAHIDCVGQTPPSKWIVALHLRLPRLYAAALALPEVEPDTDGSEHGSDALRDVAVLRNAMARVLARWDYYEFVFNPYQKDDVPVGSFLSGDLSEIYEDLMRGLEYERAVGAARPRDVLWDWRFAFRSHWARHASAALAALQAALLQEYADFLPETFGSES